MTETQTKKAMELTESDNDYLNYFKGDASIVQTDIEKAMRSGKINKDYIDSTNEEVV